VKTIGIIPCRYGAVRFPGKPLADINGRPMMWHVYQRAVEAAVLDEIYVATDDQRIFASAEQLDLPVLMTGTHHATGSDRVAECMSMVAGDVYVNIQGDEPMIDPQAIATVVESLLGDKRETTVVSNAYAFFDEAGDVVDTNNVKVILRCDGTALAYSRQPIPYPKSAAVRYRRQLGLYAFTRLGLKLFAELEPGPVELAEGVEMLRFLEHGYDVRMVEVVDRSIPVDTLADLARVRAAMAGAGASGKA
jgi:3-deoxy-manno-octulosonate cytidylyltransferase (CMP-KDO synthetase)